MAKLAGYVRVSSTSKADHEPSAAEQARAMRAWAKSNGHHVVLSPRYRDLGVCGELTERPGLSAALEAIQAGDADGLLVSRIDRLNRTLTAQEAILAQAWKAHGTVFACDAGEIPQDDPADPMRTAVRQMMGVFAQLERGMIRAKLARGKQAKRERGGYACGYVPLGMRAEDRELVPDEDEQETMRRIAALHGEGRSLREIAAVLEAEGRRPERGERWYPSAVALTLARMQG
jgi:DNA invertase Pin-like site-specific DNA recombinase